MWKLFCFCLFAFYPRPATVKALLFSKASASDTEMSLWHFLISPPPPSIIYQHELHASGQVFEGRAGGIPPQPAVARLSHFSQPRRKALTPQLWLVPFSSIEAQGHSPITRVKVIGWQPPASCIWMTDAPSAPLQNANTQASFSALFFCLKGQPCQTLHGISSTCWLQSDDLCKTIIEMQVIPTERSHRPTPTPQPLHFPAWKHLCTIEKWSCTTSFFKHYMLLLHLWIRSI